MNFTGLNTLDVMNNDLEKLPSQMGELRKLEFIYAQHNDIAELPAFSGCESLKEVHISNNFIKVIEHTSTQNIKRNINVFHRKFHLIFVKTFPN